MIHNSGRFNRRRFTTGALALTAAGRLRSNAIAAPAAVIEIEPPPVADVSNYVAYIPAACKAGQFFHYTCEFDAAWAVLKTFGVDATLEQQLAAIPLDNAFEPYYEETADGVFVYGGDITQAYCGDYTANFLARSTGSAMRHVFKQFGMRVTHVHTRKSIEETLKRGRLVWIKTTVDFLDWVPATWVTSNGKRLPVALGNDHATVVMGHNDQVVVIRDVLGPTSSNWERIYEYEVEWDRFLRCWAAQGSDGLSVGLQ